MVKRADRGGGLTRLRKPFPRHAAVADAAKPFKTRDEHDVERRGIAAFGARLKALQHSRRQLRSEKVVVVNMLERNRSRRWLNIFGKGKTEEQRHRCQHTSSRDRSHAPPSPHCYWFARIECDSEKAPTTGHFSLLHLFRCARTNKLHFMDPD